MQCHYFDAGVCRSCTYLDVPYAQQLAGKHRRAQEALAAAGPGIEWLEPWANAEAGFRNRAKMVVGGTREAPTLGILDEAGRGVDLRQCPLHEPVIVEALPHIAEFVREARLIPYDVARRQGELKHVLVTASPAGRLMIRFVLRSIDQLRRLERHLPALLDALPHADVVTVNLQPEHKAILEGPQEIHLAGAQTMTMDVGGLPLHLRPQGFFQTSTAAARALYAQAREWAAERFDPSDTADSALPLTEVWDLYCGVGGFALHLAGPGRRVLGVETSEAAVLAAARTAEEAGVDAEFAAADATAWVRERLVSGASATMPGLVVVNPPRRGIGAELAGLLDTAAGRGLQRIIYSSCNVDSLARDLTTMPSWRPARARVVDMFPHTAHMEVIAELVRA